MENLEKQKFNAIMRERTILMAVNVHKLFNSKNVIYIDRPPINQLTRSSSSVAANFRAATRARSDGEFYSKICIVVEECDETQFWFEFLSRIGLVRLTEIPVLLDEIEQLVKIFTAMKKKMKDKLNSNGNIK